MLCRSASSSEGQLSCCDVRAVSHLSVVQDLRDVARDRSFKHVLLGVGVTRIRNAGVLYFHNTPYLYAKCGMTQCPMASDTGHEARSFTYVN